MLWPMYACVLVQTFVSARAMLRVPLSEFWSCNLSMDSSKLMYYTSVSASIKFCVPVMVVPASASAHICMCCGPCLCVNSDFCMHVHHACMLHVCLIESLCLHSAWSNLHSSNWPNLALVCMCISANPVDIWSSSSWSFQEGM